MEDNKKYSGLDAEIEALKKKLKNGDIDKSTYDSEMEDIENIYKKKQIVESNYSEKLEEKDTFSASSLVSETSVNLDDIKKSSILYNTLLSCLLRQGSRLKKHSHESIMEDFRNKFGENSEDNKIEIYVIKNTDIGMEEFKSSADESERNG